MQYCFQCRKIHGAMCSKQTKAVIIDGSSKLRPNKIVNCCQDWAPCQIKQGCSLYFKNTCKSISNFRSIFTLLTKLVKCCFQNQLLTSTSSNLLQGKRLLRLIWSQNNFFYSIFTIFIIYKIHSLQEIIQVLASFSTPSQSQIYI